MSTADRVNRIVWVTASGTTLDHAVTPRNARFSGGGNHVAVCGAEFRSAPLVADPGRQCAACIRVMATGRVLGASQHCRNDGDDGPFARWRNSFRPLNLVTPVSSQRTTRSASPGEETGNRVWRSSGDDVPRPSCPESRHALDIDPGPESDPDRTERRYPVGHLLRHWDDLRSCAVADGLTGTRK